ncbi:30S ribosomal protein S2 [Candidatus Gottesmanbacteria bacterium RIFCSPLOWO2_01_FULL_43_11b]|uniref:Small ribosomal subunit protein uS2 n=1 Tax=Candidatus Gottesmanbacteria bacterium RIFCSPLOWO2_01_FULL_43_11b TaxID=1798392 RepID=A0A1F6AGQ0_9BACT|nr:MAG: 30S ribosomal protein S2 [Candidatus Gottesmanbacteria bacterium RIFCSPLOWO2_01_FULL_43_11b]
MEEITLQQLLEAGCHFGHKAERWNPKATEFIYAEKDGIHIIDLAKTKTGLEAAAQFVKEVAQRGGTVLFVATKRQASGIVKELAESCGAPYLTQRWIGGFLTNWDEVHKNIKKIIRLAEEQKTGAWKKFPKHEQTKLGHYLSRLNVFYGGVLTLNAPPDALFIVDIRKEDAAVREGKRREIPIVGVVDTNSDPADINFVIPANDDAVGSIRIIAKYIADAYKEGREKTEKESKKEEKKETKEKEKKDASKT